MRGAVGAIALAAWVAAASPAAAAAAEASAFSTDPAVMAVMNRMRAGDVLGGRTVLEGMAKAGNADAAELLGEFLRVGFETIKADGPAACRYFEQASATRGDSMHNLALCAEQGESGAAPDLPLAAKLYQRAAEMGMAKSKCALGNLLIAGKGGIAKDETRGAALCREAAEAGVADSQADVGNDYLAGVGVPHDVAQARHWYELAAAQHQRNAAYTLAEVYWNADGVPRDLTKCRTYWTIAYEAGRKDAALRLGDVAWVEAERGKDRMDPDGLQLAHDWYNKAAGLDDPEIRKVAIERRDLAAQVKDLMLRRYPKS